MRIYRVQLFGFDNHAHCRSEVCYRVDDYKGACPTVFAIRVADYWHGAGNIDTRNLVETETICCQVLGGVYIDLVVNTLELRPRGEGGVFEIELLTTIERLGIHPYDHGNNMVSYGRSLLKGAYDHISA